MSIQPTRVRPFLVAHALLGPVLSILPLPDWSDFPVFVWRQDHAGRELPGELLAPFGGTNVERGEEAPWVLDGEVDFYVGHAPGRDELHLRREPEYREWFERWYETREPGLNVRRPCLTDEDTRDRLFEQLSRSLGARGGRHGLGISLGDEVSLTPWGDPLDLCRSPSCEKAWGEWCERTGWERRDAPTTDELRLEIAEVGYRSLGAWLARRRFHQDVVLELLEELADRARELAPGVPIGLLGLAGQTAFGGVAVDRALGFLDFIEPYSVEDARELAFALRRPGQRCVTTIFPQDDESGRAAGSAWRIWEHALRGGDGLVLWSDRTLAERPEWRARLADAVREVRRARRLAPELASPEWARPEGVAVLHAADAVALAWLQDALLDGPTWPNRLAGYQRQHGTRERSLRSWLRLFEDAGWRPGAVPIDALDGETAERFPLLVVSHVGVLGREQVERLERYLAAGGRIAVEGQLGRFDLAGEEREPGLLESLRALHPTRVHDTPERLVEYADLRQRPGDARASAIQAELRGWSGRSRTAELFRVEGGALPWLRAARPTGDGGWVCMALPNATTPEERAQLVALDVELEKADGLRVEWLHPRSESEHRARLAAGDALVFRLLPR